jgi:hypothetical protein
VTLTHDTTSDYTVIEPNKDCTEKHIKVSISANKLIYNPLIYTKSH